MQKRELVTNSTYVLAGAYVGCMYQEYTNLLGAGDLKLSAATATGNSLSFMVGRVSYAFGLTGQPCLLLGLMHTAHNRNNF